MIDLNLILLFLVGYFAIFYGIGQFIQKSYTSTKVGYVVANRNAGVIESSTAVVSCWLTALGVMVSGQQLFNNGWTGYFWFTAPQILGMLIFGWMTLKIKEKIPNGYTISQWIRDSHGAGVTSLFQLVFVFSCFGVLIMTFTTLFKYIKFIEVGNAALISFMVVAGTILYSIRGGLKTSLRTGAIQTVFNITIMIALIYLGMETIPDKTVSEFLTGRKNITDLFDYNLMITFGITAALSFVTGPAMSSVHHQKSFSQHNKTPWKAWVIGAPGYLIVQTLVAFIGVIVLAQGTAITDLSTMQFVFAKGLGSLGIILIGILLLNISCIVIDAHGNGIASIIANDFVKEESNSVLVSKIALAVSGFLAWLVALAEFDLTYIFFTYGILRTNLFIILITMLAGWVAYTRRGIFWAGAIMCPATVTLGIYAMNTNNLY
jgi:Na+/proline symporter